MDKRYFTIKIAKWYLENRRPLPWRETTDPYYIWLSEVILQQTRVVQGLPYYQRFIERFPSVQDLAAADEQHVLRLWQGLGYYTRARNLHKCAKTIVEAFNGKFPATSSALEKLPGIGCYTAAAIASFAFSEKVAVVDGNVFRILSRIFGIDVPINSPDGKRVFDQLANDLIDPDQPALHNQAVMEFGATFCTPANPRCNECPFNETCVAFKHQMVTMLPVKTPKKKPRRRYFYYLVLEKDNNILMKKRSGKDIWNGLFDFVLVEKTRAIKPEAVIADKAYESWFRKSDGVKISRSYKHILTHQTIHCRFIRLNADPSLTLAEENLSFYSRAEIADLPKPALITRFLEEQNKL